jgi:hypothetical protein
MSTWRDYRKAILGAATKADVETIVQNSPAEHLDIAGFAVRLLWAHIQNEKCAISGLERNPDTQLGPEDVLRLQWVLETVGAEPLDVDAEVLGYRQFSDDLHEARDEWVPTFMGALRPDGLPRGDGKTEQDEAIQRLRYKRRQ